jgi:hypothetical protein
MTNTPIADMTAARKLTRRYRIVGMNINDNPPMSGDQVEHDLDVAVDDYRADIIVTQEMRWRWYFRRVAKVLKRRIRTSGKTAPGPSWAHSPTLARAIAAPNNAAQACFWRDDLLRREQTMRRRLHKGYRKISEARQLRGVLLHDRDHDDDPDMAWWNGTTHFVRGGDERGDPQLHKRILLEEDLPAFAGWLDDMLETGHGAIVQLDANIRQGAAAYDDFMRVVRRREGRVVGRPGIEYLLVFQPRNGTRIDVSDAWQIPAAKLHTPHEGRGLTMRLRKPARQGRIEA